jgi:ParB family chromosome partitioning protein
VEKPVSSLRPDPKQPRENAKDYVLQELADSIRSQGIIHPIEIDENDMIVTGELRWMASRKAGLKTIPCRVLEGLEPDDRFIRQLVENLQRHDMNPVSIGKSIARIRTRPVANSVLDVAKLIGKSERFVREHLALAEATDVVQAAVSSRIIPISVVSAMKSVPSRHQAEVMTKIIDERPTEEGANAIIDAVKRTPEKTKQILKVKVRDEDGKRVFDLRSKIQKISPEAAMRSRDAADVGNGCIELMKNLLRFMGKHASSEITGLYRTKVKDLTRDLLSELGEWDRELK